ncbi:hypothetical protein NitYY0826_C1732 [Nitratiruptor sp. YY08-26]|uniref:hypothetical protein n=1 Tax=unclassified Nitratiruptor TaxID=2624044 RepID=UPI00191693B2|nr:MULTISPECIES: hypothetical protein [unclassified Nitratiruptor]BCD62847.1 hypothetical protein NitYY0813_C1730 [Nitratiruptor sp. YY08-13]BCD66783.1 hypothetical protein NitYY0826_C1732 [Nitratiruptor sp. YY08-26]
MQKVTIKIEGKEYDIQLKEDFAQSLLEDLQKDLPPHSSNSIKNLLHAYLKKCYDCYVLEKRLQELLKKFPN